MKIGFMYCYESEYFPDFMTFAFKSDVSLLEFDLVLWQLEFSHFGYNSFSVKTGARAKQILADRQRRLQEIETYLESGKDLAILMSDPIQITRKHDYTDYLNYTRTQSESPPTPDNITQKVKKYLAFDKNPDVGKNNQIEDNATNIDKFFRMTVYDFLPYEIRELVKKYVVPISGEERTNEIDFKSDEAFLGFWNSLKGYAWSDIFFSSPFGTPLLYKPNTIYPVSIWYPYKAGNIFLLPSTEFDVSDDFPIFVNAVQNLVKSINNLTGKQVTAEWRNHEVIVSKIYVHASRISELQQISNDVFDLVKLIQLCKELNQANANGAFLSVTMIVRAILDHCPPIFGFKKFSEVANNYGGRSFKKNMQNLQNSLRNIADAHLHTPIRKSEVLPTNIQVDFSRELDVLLSEIVRILK